MEQLLHMVKENRVLNPSLFFRVMKTKTIPIIILPLILLTTTVYGAELSISIASQPQHKGIVCIYCHETRGFSIGDHEDEGGCENCHSIKDNVIALEKAHSQKCDKCHGIPQDKDSYHQMHKNVSCETCHISGNKPSVIMSDCEGCHVESFIGIGNIHEIHKKKLDEICSKCHGTNPKSAPVTVYDTSVSGLIETKQTLTQRVYARTIDYKKYTLYEILNKLYSSF